APQKGADDVGDTSSQALMTKAWAASDKNDLDSVLKYTNKCIELYGAKAREMQASLTEYPWGEGDKENREKIFSYWALNDVGTCLFIQGEAYRKAGKLAEAKVAFQTLLKEYSFAQCWDTQGWFWKPAESAEEKLQEM
ncbi:MAG: tetratricopeptide repeat protein, partial [Candidatus Omnitrophica bacterium]|nr:tetratricopeptide repeat protein [Candidatus Omnitrophota bacterium]